MEEKEHMLLKDYEMTVTPPECLPSEVTVTATIEFEDDLTELLPYLNAELGPCVYEANVPFLRLYKDGRPIAVYPQKIFIAGLRDEDDANEMFRWIRDTVNSVACRKGEIEPSCWSLSEIKPLDVFKLLPRTNCAECGMSTCMAFAAAIANGEAGPDDCPALSEDQHPEMRSQVLTLLGKGLQKKRVEQRP
jgi:ArsR family metal-binding transcriptional regulator